MKISTRRSSFAAVLLLSTSLSVAVLSSPASAAGNDTWSVWASSKYTYCDAKLLAATWRMPIDKAKTMVANKILIGGKRDIETALNSSRSAGNRCTWEDTGYTYEDSVKLSKLWQTADPYHAKLKVAKYLTMGQNSVVKGALRAAH